MRAFFAHLVGLAAITSALWIHDGVYLYPPPQANVIEAAMVVACRSTGLHLRIRYQSLQPQYEELLAQCHKVKITSKTIDVFALVDADMERDWWERLADTQAAIPTKVHRQLGHFHDLLDPQDALCSFYARMHMFGKP